MPPKFTRVQVGEKVISEYQDKSAWLTRKMGVTSEKSGVSKIVLGIGAIHGSIFLTNSRLIFESFDGDIVESHPHENIERTKGKDGGFTAPGNLNIFKTNGNVVEYVLYCGQKFSSYLNQHFYSSQAILSRKINLAQEREKHLDYEGAIQIYESIGKPHEAARIRKLRADRGAVKVDQTVVHGNYVDDRDTIVKDSVINRSNVGGGSSKMQELKDLTEMKEKGLISKEEYEKMKQEIIG